MAVVVPLFMLAPWPGATHAVERLTLRFADLEGPAFAVSDVALVFDARRSHAALSIGRLTLGGTRLRALRLDCGRATLSVSGFVCREARARVEGRRLPVEIDVEADARARRIALVLRPDGGGRLDLSYAAEAGAQARVVNVPVAVLQEWANALAPRSSRLAALYKPAGRVSGALDWGEDQHLALRIRVDDGAFGSADGLQAGEGLALEGRVDARRAGMGWQWRATLDWVQGAAYLHPLFVEAGPRLRAEGRLDGGRVRVAQLALETEGVERLHATVDVELAAPGAASAQVDFAGVDLAVIGPRLLTPLIAPARAEQLRFAGHLDGRLEIRAGALHAAELGVRATTIELAAAAGGAGVALGPMTGRVDWARGRRGVASLEVGGGRWEKLALGAFTLDAALGDDGVRVPRLRVPVLDGALVVDRLELLRDVQGWRGRGGVVIEPVSMPQLTAALDLPVMAGVLSAALPGLQLSPGELAFDGALVVSVFDGYLRATGLRLREPFGVASHLSADLEARHIDLAQLTDAFSFGSMSGFIDADVGALELVRWRPVAFDARIASSPGDYRRRISQRAVENISALGGAGAMAAIQRSLLGLFETFGYSEIGLRCKLARGVCTMDGIEGLGGPGGRFVIVRGGGVPALDVIGYNRRVDWNELADRLQRVIAGNVAPEVR